MKPRKLLAGLLIISLIVSLISGVAAYGAGPSSTGSTSDYRGLVISKVFGTGGKKDAVTKYSFFELCNTSNRAVDLDGLALYYKTSGDAAYKTYEFESVTMAPGSYYLIRCAAAKNYAEENEIIRLTDYDADWNISVSNKDISLILALAGRDLDVNTPTAEISEKVSYFCASPDYYFDTGYVDDLSKAKYAVRTALQEDSGWELVNLSKANSTRLEQIVPMSSSGIAGEVVNCAIDEVKFSHAPGFYKQPISLSMTAAEGYSIYYTVDGSDPTTSSSRILYSGAMQLNNTTHLGVGPTTTYVASIMGSGYLPTDRTLPGAHVIKAYATDGTNATDVFTSTYFISSEMAAYGVTVMAISMDKTDFVGSTGFYNNYYTLTNDPNPRSLGTLEVFDENGVRQGYSDVQFAINGHGSAEYGMKSMKVYYKKDFNKTGGRENKLYYDLFEGNAKNSNGQTITTFSKILLRNSGNDCPYTMLRDAYQQRVSAGLSIDTTAAAPVLVFVNGEFWGCYNARERYCQDYVEAHYGVTDDNVVLLENDYTKVHSDLNAPIIVNDGEGGDADPFNALVTFIKTHDMSVVSNYEYVAGQMDIDSFIDMYIAHLYMNATDWPENNIKIWRNKAEDDLSGFDNKWHFVLHDMDFGVYYHDSNFNNPPTKNIFSAIDDTKCTIGNMMHALIKNQSFKETFLARFYTVIRNIYTPENLTAVLDEMVAARDPLMEMHIGRWGQGSGAITRNRYESSLADMYTFVSQRQTIALKQMCSYFSVSEDTLKSLCGLDASAESILPPTMFVGASFDNLYVNGTRVNNPAGNASVWLDANIPDRTIDGTSGNFQTIGWSGWIGFDNAIEAFGYQINDEEPVWGNFAVATEDVVKLDIHGGMYASRFNITVPVRSLTDVNTIVAVVKVNGQVVKIDANLLNTNGIPSPDTTIIFNNRFELKTKTSYDLLRVNNVDFGSYCNNPNPATLNLDGQTGKQLEIFGWHSNNIGISAFGYRIDGGSIVYNSAFRVLPEQAVINAGKEAVGQGAISYRMRIYAPIQEGAHTIEAVCNTGSGEIVIWTINYTNGVVIPVGPVGPTPEPALTVEKAANPSTGVKAGDAVTYTVVVTNSGNVTVTDIALGDTLVNLNEAAFDLEAGASKTVAYTYTVTQADVDAGKIYNTVTANGKDPGGNVVTADSAEADPGVSVLPNIPDEPDEPDVPEVTAVLIGASFDSFYQNGSLSALHCKSDGGASALLDQIGRTITDTDGAVHNISFRGWIGFDQAIEAFGYQINDGDPVFASFFENTEAAVKLAQNGGPKAQRFKITIPVSGLTGDNSIIALVKLADGTVIKLDGSTPATGAKALPNISVTYKVPQNIVLHTSRDQLKVNGKDVGSYGNNSSFCGLNLSGKAGNTLEIFGWHSNNIGIVKFGYRIDGGDIVYNSAFTSFTNQAVYNAGAPIAGTTGATSRMDVFVPILTGRHVVEIICNNGREAVTIWTVAYKA